MLVLLSLLALRPRLLLPPLVRIDGAMVPELLERLDPLDLRDEPEDDEPELLVDVSAEGLPVWTRTPALRTHRATQW